MQTKFQSKKYISQQIIVIKKHDDMIEHTQLMIQDKLNILGFLIASHIMQGS